MKIGILGCGWLGLPLGTSLVKAGHTVLGSVRNETKSAPLEAVDIVPFVVNCSPDFLGDTDFFDVDVLVISLPPRAAAFGDTHHPEQIKSVLATLTSRGFNPKIIYLSSTSVYPETSSVFTENSPVLPTHPLVQAEALVRTWPHGAWVLRLAGLMGYDRIAAKYFLGKTITTGAVPVNYLHRDDAVGIITKIIENPSAPTLFNIVAPQHPTRKEVYEYDARTFGWEVPQFAIPEVPHPERIISCERLVRIFELSVFRYPDPLLFWG